jgi:hypothetical protein
LDITSREEKEMQNIDTNRMQQVVETALQAVQNNKRWTNAVVRAAVEMEVNDFMSWNGHALVIWSKSNEVYEANGTCQCKAYEKGQPCWHRAAARLVQRYNETAH